MNSTFTPLLARIVMLSTASTAWAQDASPRDTTRLVPIVITATRVPQPAATSVATVTVLDGEDLRSRGITRVADALREVPGLSLVSSGSPGASTSLFARGGNSNFVKVLVDGVAQNEAGGAYDFAHLTTDNVERIEVVRGPVSALYGTDAVSGVVQIFTREGGRGGTLRARGGTYGTNEAMGDLSRTEPWGGVSLGAGHHATSGIYAFNGQYRNEVLSGNLHSGVQSPVDLRLTTRLSEAEFHFPTTGSGVPVDSNAFTRERRAVIGLDVAKRVSRAMTLRAGAGDNELRRLSDDRPDSPGDTSGFYSTNRADVSRRSLDARADLSLGATSIATIGAQREWQREFSRTSSQFARFPASDTSFTQSRGNQGLYAQLLSQPGILSVALSGRADDNEKYGTFRTWRAGGAVSLPMRTTLRAAGGTGFREPAFSEVFSTAFTNGNAALEPERSANWEIGVGTRSWAAVPAMSVVYFHQRFTNLIQYVGHPFGSPLPNFGNLAAALAHGVEFEATALPAEHVRAAVAYTRLWTKVIDAGNGGGSFVRGEQLIRRPARTASGTLAWSSTPGSISVTAIRTGYRTDRNFSAFPAIPVLLDPYTKVDASGEWSVIRESAVRPSVAVTLRVENAGNTGYQQIYGYRTPGRTLLAGVSIGRR